MSDRLGTNALRLLASISGSQLCVRQFLSQLTAEARIDMSGRLGTNTLRLLTCMSDCEHCIRHFLSQLTAALELICLAAQGTNALRLLTIMSGSQLSVRQFLPQLTEALQLMSGRLGTIALPHSSARIDISGRLGTNSLRLLTSMSASQLCVRHFLFQLTVALELMSGRLDTNTLRLLTTMRGSQLCVRQFLSLLTAALQLLYVWPSGTNALPHSSARIHMSGRLGTIALRLLTSTSDYQLCVRHFLFQFTAALELICLAVWARLLSVC
ncbi:unnamed protein product [Acanthosepion pharaonis]|uniref:Uncharacterized protein n=1 Tax=Acanthosepion pharaonis TaxID=158019 RepID=A0A812CW65_ACAPH|nr:unnamed protein product [Sepia pharaonis]